MLNFRQKAVRCLVGIVFILPCLTFASPSSAQSCSPHLSTGMPISAQNAPATFLCRPGYATLHNDTKKVPFWVEYELTGERSLGCVSRKDTFKEDPDLLPDRRAKLKDYTNSGYSKGHNAPAADMAWDERVSAESFYLSNMTPQLQALNGVWWAQLEDAVRSWSIQRERIIIITGPVFNPQYESFIGLGQVGVPSGYYKIIYEPTKEESISFIVPHAKLESKNFDHWIHSIEKVEEMVNFHFLPSVDRSKIKQSITSWPIEKDVKSLRKSRCGRKS